MEPSNTGGMSTEEKIRISANGSGYKSPARYAARAGFLFSGIDLSNKAVLDIGCGLGTWSLWAGIHGAAQVLGIEPEKLGSTNGTFEKFEKTISKVGLRGRVKASNIPLEDMTERKAFDIAIAYSVINHFSESHTKTLHKSPESLHYFLTQFRHIREILKPGGVFIASDTSNRNLFGDIGLRNPFAPSICWEIHQPPEVWESVLSQAGFKTLDVRWAYAYPLRRLTANRIAAYVLGSSFVLRMIAE